MKRLLLSLSALILGTSAFAQQDYQFSQYMFDRLSLNPAFAGIDDKICATGIFRQQWASFDGAPRTVLFNAHGPVKALRGGVGLSVYNDKIGFFNTTSAKLSYSFQFPLGPGKMGVGASVGFMSSSLKPSWVAITPVSQDAAIPNGNESQATYDLGLGLYYRTPEFYVGLSATHLSESEFTQLNVQNARHYYLIAGWDKRLGASNSDWTLRPSVRVESDATTTQVDANVNVLWRQTVWAGVSYRMNDAIVPMAGFQTTVGGASNPGMIRIGYSYDVTTSEIKNYSNGSHEIMLNYCFNIIKPPVRQKAKTVRFL